MNMKKYYLYREYDGQKWYFKGKANKEYWEGSTNSIQFNTCAYDNYLEALFMKAECLFLKCRLYKIECTL